VRAKLRLGDHCLKIGSGATPRGGKEAYLAEGPYSLIRSQNVLNERFSVGGLAFLSQEQADQLSNVEVQPGDVLLNITGDSLARVCQVDPTVLPARVNQHVAIIRPKPEVVDPRFLRYFLVSPEMQAHMLGLAASGATRNALTKGMIEKFEVPAVPLPEQRAIAATLGALDDKIELNRKMNATLEAMARALFRDWFVDFGPTRAKMEGRAAYLSPDLWPLFPDRLDAEGKPEGWEMRSLGSVVHRVTKGTTPNNQQVKSALDEPSINFLRVNNLSDDGSLLLGNIAKVAQSVHQGALKRSILQQDDILYSIAGTIGRVAKVVKELLPSNVNQAIAIVRPDPKLSPPSYILMWLSDYGFQNELHSKIVQAVQANLSLGMLSDARMIFPPRDVLTSLLQPIDALLDRKEHNERESHTLAQTRDLLLPRLMSGELRVAEAEPIAASTV